VGLSPSVLEAIKHVAWQVDDIDWLSVFTQVIEEASEEKSEKEGGALFWISPFLQYIKKRCYQMCRENELAAGKNIFNPVIAYLFGIVYRIDKKLPADNYFEAIRPYPLLIRIMSLYAYSYVDDMRLLFSNLKNDKEIIGKTFFNSTADIISIDALSTDFHGPHTGVFLIVCKQGRVVYKGRGVVSSVFFNDITDRYFREYIYGPPCLQIGPHGYMGFVVEALPDSKWQDYFYRWGALTALFSVCLSTDMHEENVIAADRFPVLIDAETLITSRTVTEPFQINALDRLIRTAVFTHSGTNIDDPSVNVLGPLCRHIQASIQSGYGEMDGIERRVVDGFQDAAEIIIKNKESMLRRLQSNEYNEVFFRFLMRPTQIYTVFLSNCFTSLRAANREAYRENMGRIKKVYAQFDAKTGACYIGDYEAREIQNGSIPLFYVKYKDAILYGKDRVITESFLAASPCELLLHNIRTFDKAELRQCMEAIHYILKNDFVKIL
jgi:lantibiotic modifying enzyme